MNTSARGQSGLLGWLGLLAWLAVGLLVNVAGAQAAETVWVDDATPAGAGLYTNGGDNWTWITGYPAPYSGTQAHQSVVISGQHQHYFVGAPATGQLSVNVGDKLFTYVYLDPVNPPSEIMLQWHTNTWEHRAYWGANNIPWGMYGTVSQLYMGVLPAAGQWVRLEVPASQVGLEGSTLDGMAFTLFDGSATWDRAGKASSSTIVPTVSLTTPANGATYTAPANITLSATAAESGGTISKVEFYNGVTLLGTSTSAPYTLTLSNVAAGSYPYTAKAYDSVGTSTTSPATWVTVSAPLSAPWLNQDIGAPGLAGSANESGGTYTIQASGSDIWDVADSFNYTYQTLNGDGQIIARVASLQYTDSWAKAGIMIRQDLTASSAHANLVVTAGNGIAFQSRPSAGALTSHLAGATVSAPYWLKLTRTGNTLSGYQSPDGVTWTQLGSYTLTLSPTVYIGLSLTAHNNGVLNTSSFDNVSVTSTGSTISPSVSLTAPTNGATYTAPASITLSASAAESGGTISRIDFYSGASLLGAATAAPYTYTWSNVPAGSYTFTAVATDTSNVSTTSSPVSVSVGAAVATQIYYIYTDQLNTPRLITDTANSVVWRNDQADPFNASAPYDDPGNTGHHFVFNLRFPGQYYDQETGLAYNYFRDYDANTGRYVQSDPIGLAGGMNTYSYVGGDPLSYVDSEGLDALSAIVKLGVKGGMKIKKLVCKEAAVEARRKGKNVLAPTRQQAKEIEKAANGGKPTLRHSGHELPDGSTGRPHFQTEGANGHTFYGAGTVGTGLAGATGQSDDINQGGITGRDVVNTIIDFVISPTEAN